MSELYYLGSLLVIGAVGYIWGRRTGENFINLYCDMYDEAEKQHGKFTGHVRTFKKSKNIPGSDPYTLIKPICAQYKALINLIKKYDLEFSKIY
jgi:hypothetical protein